MRSLFFLSVTFLISSQSFAETVCDSLSTPSMGIICFEKLAPFDTNFSYQKWFNFKISAGLENLKENILSVDNTTRATMSKTNELQNQSNQRANEINDLQHMDKEIRREINELKSKEIASLKEEFRIYKERSACPLCVNLPANTESEMKKKYHCFKTGIEQWERSEKNFDNKCIGTLVGHIKQLPQLDDGDWFGEDEINYILDLAARYPSFLRIK